jgi:hypothetical protein
MELFENEIVTIIYKDNLIYYYIKKLIDDPVLHKEFLDHMDLIYKRIKRENHRFKQIFDARKAESQFSIGMVERLRELGTFLREREEFILSYCDASVVIVESPVIRGVLSFLLMFYENKKPIEFVSTEEDAKRWFLKVKT